MDEIHLCDYCHRPVTRTPADYYMPDDDDDDLFVHVHCFDAWKTRKLPN